MRVVHVLHSFGTGGMEKGVAALVSGASRDFEHVIVCLSRSGDSRRLVPQETRIVELEKGPGHSFGFVFRLAAVLRSLRPDLVHTRNWAGLDGILACRMSGIHGVVHGEHGWGIEDPDGENPKRVAVRNLVSPFVKEYTCVSKQMVHWLHDTIRVRAPVSQIYNGVDPQHYGPSESPGAVRQSLGISSNAFVITICGRLDPIKDHPTLFRSFEFLRREHADAYLLVVGDGPERQRLISHAGEHVIFLGNRPDVPAILGETDLFALVSLNEGISNTILEAMAVGLPVLATRVGGNPELVDRDATGILVSPGNEQDILSALRRYYDSGRLRTEHGAAGRKKVLTRFSLSKMVEQYEDVYRRVEAASRGPRAG